MPPEPRGTSMRSGRGSSPAAIWSASSSAARATPITPGGWLPPGPMLTAPPYVAPTNSPGRRSTRRVRLWAKVRARAWLAVKARLSATAASRGSQKRWASKGTPVARDAAVSATRWPEPSAPIEVQAGASAKGGAASSRSSLRTFVPPPRAAIWSSRFAPSQRRPRAAARAGRGVTGVGSVNQPRRGRPRRAARVSGRRAGGLIVAETSGRGGTVCQAAAMRPRGSA